MNTTFSAVTDKVKKVSETKVVFVTILVDFSKKFDYISYEMLLSKHYDQSFDKMSLHFIQAFLKKQKQKTKKHKNIKS